VNRRLKQAVVVVGVGFAAAQLIRPDGANPTIAASRTIQAQAEPGALASILERSCRDCHSNRTQWPWYTRVAPVSWAMAYGVRKGRMAVNFSEWTAYQPEQQATLLALSCEDASKGKMPGPWTLLHPEAKLSTRDIQTICSAARQAEAIAARRF
jgi:hypothetical protein